MNMGSRKGEAPTYTLVEEEVFTALAGTSVSPAVKSMKVLRHRPCAREVTADADGVGTLVISINMTAAITPWRGIRRDRAHSVYGTVCCDVPVQMRKRWQTVNRAIAWKAGMRIRLLQNLSPIKKCLRKKSDCLSKVGCG